MLSDNYVFDSQFMFLPDQQALKSAYDKTVRSNELFSKDGLRAYYRTESWDSNYFKKNIARLVSITNRNENEKYRELNHEMKKFDCVYLRLNETHSYCSFAEYEGIPLLCSKVTQFNDLKDFEPKFAGDINYMTYSSLSIMEREAVLKDVLLLSRASFVHGRFRADKNFDPDLIDGMYAGWVENEVKAQQSELYFLQSNGKLVSFFLYRKNISPLNTYKIGFVSLIASAVEYKNRNFAGSLLNYVINQAKSENTQYIVANTETTNTSALSFFNKNGFLVSARLNEYHLWN